MRRTGTRRRRRAGRRAIAVPSSLRLSRVALVAGLGVLLTAYLLITRVAHTAVYCPLGRGCEIVQSSRFGTLFGIPVAAFGMLFYGVVLGLSMWPADRMRRWLLPVAAAGVAASVMFTVVQQTQIRATCSLCLLSALVTVVILVLVIMRRPRMSVGSWTGAAAAVTATVLFVLAAFAVSAPIAGTEAYAAGLARHLASTGAVFYGAYWCPHCADQKALFGGAAGLLPHLECDPRSPAGRPDVCSAKQIRVYPTWDIAGQRHLGTLSLEALARLSGFPPPP